MGNLLQIEVLLSINQEGLQPSSTQLAKTLFHILLSRSDCLLARFALEECTHEGLSHPHDFSIHLILKLPFLARKQPCFVLEIDGTEKTVLGIHYVRFALESEFAVSHSQPRHFARGRLENYPSSVVELDGAKALVYPFS